MQMSLFSKLFQFVMLITARHKIDESHGLSHSMDVLHFAHNIFNTEVYKNPELVSQERLIYVSAIIHDMCDKKYMSEKEGVAEIEEYLGDKLTPLEIDTTTKIVSTMSYSTVKKNGFPDLGLYMPAYHIVRESDLLSAYDFDRSMIYHMYNGGATTEQAFNNAKDLFKNRIFKHEKDELLTTDYAKTYYPYLQSKALARMNAWERILSKKM
jgi:HD superfamily phosphodiesterase